MKDKTLEDILKEFEEMDYQYGYKSKEHFTEGEVEFVKTLLKQSFQDGYNHALEEVDKWASDCHIISEKTSNTYWWTRGDEIGRGEVYKEVMRDILQHIATQRQLIKEIRV